METNVTNGNRKSDMFICSSGEETLQLLGFQLGNVGNCGKKQRSEQIEGPQGSACTLQVLLAHNSSKVKMIMSIFGKPVETLEFYLGLEGYTRYTR